MINYGLIISILLGLSTFILILGFWYDKRKKKANIKPTLQTKSLNATAKGSTENIVLPPIAELTEVRKITKMEKLESKFTFRKVPKKYYLIQKATPIGSALRYGEKFHAGVIEEKGKLWLNNEDHNFFIEKPDERNLVIIDNQEGFIYKNIGQQWLLQGYNLDNGNGNNIYTVDEQSDFLRTLEAKFWQYQGKKNLNKDKWSFWGLVVLGLLIMFAMGLNAYQTNKFMGNVNDIVNNDVLDNTDKALILKVIRNQEKLSSENIDLITTIKEKGLNIREKLNKQEGVVFK